MKEKNKTNNIDDILQLLKQKEITPSDNFTNNVMDCIKNDSSFDDSLIEDDKLNDILETLSFKEQVKPSDDFTANVMKRIALDNKLQTSNDIDDILSLLKQQPVVLPSDNFTNNVIDKINAIDEEDNIISFQKVYKKFLIGSAIVAAATVLLALNLFSEYNPAMAEFMATDYFTAGLY